MKNTKRILSFVLAVIMLAGLLLTTGCSNENEVVVEKPATAEKNEEVAVGENAEAEEIVVYKVWSPATLQSGGTELNTLDTPIGQAFAEKTGIAFEIHYLQSGADPVEAFNLLLSSGGYEDYDIIGLSGNATEKRRWQNELKKVDAIISLDEYFEGGTYLNLEAIPDKAMDLCKLEDGKIYSLNTTWYEDLESQFGFWGGHGWYVFPEYLEAVGMTEEDLTTLDGVEAFLKAVKEAELKNADGQTVYPLSMGQIANYTRAWYSTVLPSFGVSTAGDGFYEYDGELLHYRDNPVTKEAMKWMNSLYNQGLIDPEYITHTNDQFVEKVMTKRIAMAATPAQNFWSSVTSGETPATDLLILDYPKADGVDTLGTAYNYNPFGGAAYCITTACSNPDAYLKAVDMYSAVGAYGQWNTVYGPRGIYWDWDSERGEPYFEIVDEGFAAAQGDYAAMEKYGQNVISNAIPTSFSLDLNFYRKENEATLSWIFDMHEKNTANENYAIKIRDVDNYVYDSESAYAVNSAILTQLDIDYFNRMISCKESDFEAVWAEFHNELEAQGHWSEVKAEIMAVHAELGSN